MVKQEFLFGVIEPASNRLKDDVETNRQLIRAAERNLLTRDCGLVVGAQIMRRVKKRNNSRKALLVKPDELFLTANLAVVAREASRALRCR
jgi:uncharacterized membrane protein YukC